MRIILCVTPEFHSETPPLGLAYLKASLGDKGHFVRCLNFSEKNGALGGPSEGLSGTINDYAQKKSEVVNEWVEKIAALKPDIVGMTLWTSTRNASCALAMALKTKFPKLLVIGGGPDTVREKIDEYLKYFDLVVEKEGELAICQLVEEYRSKGCVSETKGVWSLKNGKVHLTAPVERIKDLDALPFPDFSDFETKSFQGGFPVMFSRGCNSYCTFCLGKKYFINQISRSGANVFREIKTQIQKTGCSKFVFADDSLISATTSGEFEVFCDKVLEEKLNIEWRIYGQRISPLFNEEYVRKMVMAGLKQITFGVESFSEKVRKDMGKVTSDAITDQNLTLFTRLGAGVSLLMIYGYPSETDEDFERTLLKIREMSGRFAHICFNCFGINLEYCNRRPGVVRFQDEDWHPFKWFSETVDLEKRKERFLRLVEVLDSLNQKYLIFEPCLKRSFRNWNNQLKQELLAEWKSIA
ncbi:MAG: radical SAM protein [Candidatus Omnitrophica bacterium]|nr:radical SAM protein [Candidatus Omnitrophota bacterium]